MKLSNRVYVIFLTLFFSVAMFQVSAQVDIYPSGYITASAYAIPVADKPLDAAGLRGALNLDGYINDAQFRLSTEIYSNLAGTFDSSTYTGEWYYPGAWEGSWNERLMFSGDLKEAWVGFALGDFDLTLGKQLLTWGQADGTNPTDNINPKYIGTRSVSGSQESKMGVPMVNLVYYLPGNIGTIQGLLMPYFSSNHMPLFSELVSVEAPGFAIDNIEGGVRALIYPGSVSLSVSYLTILDRYPTDAVTTAVIPFPLPAVTYPNVLGHSRQHIMGFDAVWLTNGFDLRTEWAFVLTEDLEGTDAFGQNSFVSGVVQGSRSFFNSTTTISLSWAPKYIVNFDKPIVPPNALFLSPLYVGQGFELENMVGLRIQSKYFNETFQPEIMFLTALSALDYLVTIGISYNLADGWNLNTGVNIYGSFRSESDADRQFGVFGNDISRDNDTVFLELRFDF
jgi:hypothetical protein